MLATLMTLGALAMAAPGDVGLPAAADTFTSAAPEPASVPDGVQDVLQRLQPDVIRVIGDFGVIQVEQPWAAVDGLHFIQGGATTVARASGDDPLIPDHPVPWERLSEIRTRGSATSLGARLGFYAGGIAAIVYGVREGFDTRTRWFGSGAEGLSVLLVPVAGGLAGAAVGAVVPTWRTVWRAGEAEP
jgi:hypothetical protein